MEVPHKKECSVNIKPQGNYIFVKENSVQSGTIIVAESKLTTSWICEWVGPNCVSAKPGDVVLLGRGHLAEHRIGDVTYKVIREDDIQAYVE
jgi:co-chaperonin GroES (HSP10)